MVGSLIKKIFNIYFNIVIILRVTGRAGQLVLLVFLTPNL